MLTPIQNRLSPAGRVAVRAAPTIAPEFANSDWCVGDAPLRWDISFTDRLMLTFRRFFSRKHAVAKAIPPSAALVTPFRQAA